MLKITRTQYEMQDIQHQLDQAKLRLTTDLKVKKNVNFLVFIVFILATKSS
jgi:hypothetical protein